MDTLGQDISIEKKVQNQVLELMEYLSKSWENTELKQFHTEIDLYNNYSDKFGKNDAAQMEKL